MTTALVTRRTVGGDRAAAGLPPAEPKVAGKHVAVGPCVVHMTSVPAAAPMLRPCRPGSSPRRMHAAGRGEFFRGTVRGHPAPPPRCAVGVCAVSDDPPCNPGLLR